jgi:serine O-acetyltransferase
MFENLKADLGRAMRETRDPNWEPSLRERIEVLVRHSTWPVVAHRFSHWTLGVRIPVIGQLLRVTGLLFRKLAELFTSVHINVHAKIGPGFVIHTVYAINLGAITAGKNLTVATGVLIAHACRGIGDNVYFGPGAKLVGDAKIGNNVVVAANSLVLTDVADNFMVMGVPARIKLQGGQPRRFLKQPETAPEAQPVVSKSAESKAPGAMGESPRPESVGVSVPA